MSVITGMTYALVSKGALCLSDQLQLHPGSMSSSEAMKFRAKTLVSTAFAVSRHVLTVHAVLAPEVRMAVLIAALASAAAGAVWDWVFDLGDSFIFKPIMGPLQP